MHKIEIMLFAALSLPLWIVVAAFTLLATLSQARRRMEYRVTPVSHNRIARRLFRQASYRYALRPEPAYSTAVFKP